MKKNKSLLLSTPYILWMLAFTLIPLGVVVYYALTDSPTTGNFTTANLQQLLEYLPVFGQSVWYSLISAFICLLIGYPVAYYIAHRTPLMQKILYMLVMLPMCMSFLLRTLAWVGLLQDTGIINTLLGKLGIGPLPLIRNAGAVILGMVYNYLPFMILPLYSVMLKIQNTTIEAAQDLGCNPFKAFFKVILPSISSGIVTGFIMAFTLSLDDFVISYFLAPPNFQPLPLLIYSMTKRRVTPDMYALSTLMFAAVLTLLILFNFAQARATRKKADR